MERTTRSLTHSLVILMGAALACSGGANSRVDAGSGAELECAGCHTAANLSAAHAVHIAPAGSSSGFACSECHPPFATLSHANWPTSVTFATGLGDIATSGGLAPAWNAATKTCSSVYCHGGRGTVVSWNIVDGSQSKCDSCHGDPPVASSHVQCTQEFCQVCHSDAIQGGGIDVGSKLHINGEVDVMAKSEWGTVAHGASTKPAGHPAAIDFTTCEVCHGSTPVGNASSRAMNCSSCHGAATPLDCAGCHDSSSLSAGHSVHVAGSSSSGAFPCSECHTLYTSMSHTSGDPVVTFATAAGNIASTGGLSPSWSAAPTTCSSVYCHGGDGTVVNWSIIDGSQVKCDSCHGNPPASNSHIQCTKDFCYVCHTDVVQGGTISNAALHVNGAVDVMPESAWGTVGHGTHTKPPGHWGAIEVSTCQACHGPTRVGNAPSQAMDCASCHINETLDCATCHPSAKLSGAHAVHINGGPDAKPFSCSECHTIYTSLGHAAGDPVVTFATGTGDIAKTGGLSPVWNAATTTCSSVYCHGTASPDWTRVDGSQDKCDSCHGDPPTANSHVQCTKDFCNVCHVDFHQGGFIDTNRKQLHINGTADVMPESSWGTVEHGYGTTPPDHPATDMKTCDVCHGSPPVGPALVQKMTCTTCHD
jgi:predicted CxxxxCH...CXXCH cytochrome family protein